MTVRKPVHNEPKEPRAATPEEPRAIPKDEERCHQIAEAAYYKAEKRGFEPGHEMEDWLEAEAETEQQVLATAAEEESS